MGTINQGDNHFGKGLYVGGRLDKLRDYLAKGFLMTVDDDMPYIEFNDCEVSSESKRKFSKKFGMQPGNNNGSYLNDYDRYLYYFSKEPVIMLVNSNTGFYVVPVRKPKSLLHEGLSIYIRSKNIKKTDVFF